MTLTKSKRLDRLKTAWWIDDWSSTLMSNKANKALSQNKEYPPGINLKSNVDSMAMTKTKDFLSHALMPSKGVEGTIIVGSTLTTTFPELHEILLNIQPFGWIYIPEGKNNEN